MSDLLAGIGILLFLNELKKKDKEEKRKKLVKTMQSSILLSAVTGAPKKVVKTFAMAPMLKSVVGKPVEKEQPVFENLFYAQSEGDIIEIVEKRLEDYILFIAGESYLNLGTKQIPIHFRAPITQDEKYGGIDIITHPEKFWSIKLKLRNRKTQNLYPSIIGWKNRMPYDHGHRHRRWYVNDIKLEKNNRKWWTRDTITQTFLEPIYHVSAHNKMVNAIEGYTRRRWHLKLRSVTHNEAEIPSGGNFIRTQDAYPFLLTFFERIFATTDFIILCDRTYRSCTGYSAHLQSVMVGLYGPRSVNNAREFRRQAKVFMVKTIIEIAKIIGRWIGLGKSLDDIGDSAETWFTYALHKISLKMGKEFDYENAAQFLKNSFTSGLEYSKNKALQWGSETGGTSYRLLERFNTGEDLFTVSEINLGGEFADTIIEVTVIYPQADLQI